jgi:CHAT domain-containing protein
MGMMPFHQLRISLVVAFLLLRAAHVGAQAPSLEECRAEIQESPANPVAYYCVYRSVLAHGRQDEAAAMLRQSFRENPRVFRIEMFIAWIDRMRAKSDSDDLLQEAIDGMEETGDVHGVVYGGLDLAYRLGERGEFTEAEALLDRCARAAEKTGDPTMGARVWIGQAAFAQRHADYSQWLHLTRRAERVSFPDGPYDLRCAILDNLGAAYWYLCRYREAFEAFEKAAQIREQAHDFWWQAGSVYNMALCAGNLLREGEMETGEYLRILDRGRDLAIESGNYKAEPEITLLLGQQLSGVEALSHFDQALEIARRQALIQVEINALRFSGIVMAEMGPRFREESDRRLFQARERARETGQDFLLGETLADEARVKARWGSPEEGIAAHLDALDLIERVRAPQVEGNIRAQAFSHWAGVYYRLAGFLLQGSASSATPAEDHALAFRTIERFRARELLETIAAPNRYRQAGIDGPALKRRRDVLTRIAEVQRALSDPKLDPSDRQAALRELENLEVLESDLKDQLLRESPAFAALHQPMIPDLTEIQALLAPDQALLSYQLWDGESSMRSPLEIGRSWLMLITRDQVRTFALPGRRDLRARIEILEGLLSVRGTSEASGVSASVRFYEDLLQDALATLPAEIQRLVIIPDDVLFRCPFAGLGPSDDAGPLCSRFEISVVPSAAVWVHLKNESSGRIPDPRSAALIFSAPTIGEGDEEELNFRAADPWIEGLRLAPLRHAGREARSLKRVAGRGSLMVSGADASEQALKEIPLGDYRIIGLVTHAVVDEEQPERSAIILAPGSEAEDGFLQVREIADLSLDGQLVILSSCRSSSGRILGGEGAQSLARAFLQAGAGAVLASLWPLEDEEASMVFSSFSEALGRGRSVAGALSEAQLVAIDTGMPAASWAGLVILGDGDLRPVSADSARNWMWILVGILVTASYGAFRMASSRVTPTVGSRDLDGSHLAGKSRSTL